MLASVASMIDLFNMDNIEILLGLGYEVDAAANFEFGSITSRERVDEFRRELECRGIGVYHVPIPRDLSHVRDMAVSYRMIKELADKKSYDIVHCHSPIGGVLCRLACRSARRHGTKVIYTAHGFHFFKGAGLRAWMLYYPAEMICSFFTDVLVTINREDYQAAKRFYAGRNVYVPGAGVRTDEIKNTVVDRKEKRTEFGFTDSDFVFMSTGQVSVRKNHETVIRALAQIQDKSIKYLIAGFGELEDMLRQLAAELGVSERVIFAGYRQDVKELLHAVDAFAFPSLQEGLPAALMEAMAAGLPVVASRIRGNIELIEDGKGGYLVDCHDSAAFAQAISKVLHSDMEAMGVANRERIQMFDIRRVNTCMRKIYRYCESQAVNVKMRSKGAGS